MKLQSAKAYFEHQFIRDQVSGREYLTAFIVAVLASLLVYGLEHLTVERFSNISGVLILAVLVSATLFGTGPAILTAVVCSFLFDWLVVPPFFGAASSGDNIIKFSVFVVAALLTSWIAGMARRYAIALTRRERDLLAAIEEKERYKREREQEAVKSEAQALRNAILTSVSHDLKTPLASIIGAVSSYRLYGSGLSEEDKSRLINSVLTEANKLHGYLNNILEVARFGDQPLPLKCEYVAVDDVIDLTIKRLSQTLRRHRIDIRHEAGEAGFNGDERLMDIALGNVLENACKFSEGGSTIIVSTGVAEVHRQLIIEIADSGVGVTDEEAERVFDKFYRAAGIDRKNSGTGLGLWIAKRIVQAHGGTISLSGRGRQAGALVSITLPLAEMPALRPEGLQAGS